MGECLRDGVDCRIGGRKKVKEKSWGVGSDEVEVVFLNSS